jgi:hypothetical protein
VASTFIVGSFGAAAFAAVPLTAVVLSLVAGHPGAALQLLAFAAKLGGAGFAGGAVAGALAGAMQMGSHFAIVREQG